MAKTFNEIRYTILELATNMNIIDDESIPVELIGDMIHDVRDALIDREYKKFGRLDAAFYTKCSCVEVKCEEIKCMDLEGNMVESGVIEKYITADFINKSVGSLSIRFVGSPDLNTSIRPLSVPYGVGGPQTRHLPGYMFIGDKIILKNIDDDSLGVLTIIAITKNGSCSSGECNPDEEYNIPSHLIHELEGMVLKRLGASFGIKRDQKNNTSDEV